MAIFYSEDKKIISINTANSTYQMKIDKYGTLLHLYYGKRIKDDTEHLIQYIDRAFSGNPYEAMEDRKYSLDVLPQEYPSLGTGDFRSVALNVKNSDDSECCRLKYMGHSIIKGKYSLPGLPAVYADDEESETLEIVLKDEVSGIEVKLLYGVIENEDIITRSAIITNNCNEKITLEKAGSACLDFLYGQYDLISFHGKHNFERGFQRRSIEYENTVIGSRRGTSGHQYNPAVIIAEKSASETMGNCYGMAFVYSGNFMFEAERDQFGLTRTIMGLQSDLFHYLLEPGEKFVVPETIMTFTEEGFSGITKNFHGCIRKHICRGIYKNEPRPVLINSWEAVYFDFSAQDIIDLASEASKLGIDMVVMDDGWFGIRNDDNSGLGDWIVNEKKLGCTLGELAEKVNSYGVKFGIWIEPEMVSMDSDLYRNHPDWAIKIPGRNPVRSRNQLVLDFSRSEVRNYIFDMICKILDQSNIEYVKWDMNRSLTDIFSTETPVGNVTYDYVLGVYEFLERLRNRYPKLLIEGCSGGGGRFDAGMLYYTDQIWCSDNTDAVNRLKIQYGTSFFYPVSVTGAHVSAVPNHQTGRITPMSTRNTVAMSGTFGYELNLKALTEEGKENIKSGINFYKAHRKLISDGNYYRLSSPYEDDFTAWEFVSEDKKQVLLNAVYTKLDANPEISVIKLRGLLSDAGYRETSTGKVFYGETLMSAGICIPYPHREYESYVFEFEIV